MSALLKSPLLLALLALAFVIGHGHQGIERFHAHEHGTAPECRGEAGHGCLAAGGADPQREGGDHGREEHPAPGHGHCCTHGSVAAVLNAPSLVPEARRRVCDWLQSADALLPDAPVAGIEHPPQIATG